jgi:hypothetical protein
MFFMSFCLTRLFIFSPSRKTLFRFASVNNSCYQNSLDPRCSGSQSYRNPNLACWMLRPSIWNCFQTDGTDRKHSRKGRILY